MMPDRRALYDLHVHTGWSYDATAGVAEVFAAAQQAGVRHIAITEHHLIDSLGEVQEVAARCAAVDFIPGAELTVHTSIGAVDMVCLGFTEAAVAALAEVWDVYHSWQQEYGAAVCAGMRAAGFDYTDAHREQLLRSYRPPHALSVQGITHVANRIQREYFLQRGFIQTPEQYAEVLAEAGRLVPHPDYPAADFVLPRVKSTGALLVIAHPTRYFLGNDRARMDLLRSELLLDGIECAHPGVPEDLRPLYRQYCLQYGLVSTGGSDLHWSEEAQQAIGRHGGADEWWPEIAARLPRKITAAGWLTTAGCRPS